MKKISALLFLIYLVVLLLLMVAASFFIRYEVEKNINQDAFPHHEWIVPS